MSFQHSELASSRSICVACFVWWRHLERGVWEARVFTSGTASILSFDIIYSVILSLEWSLYILDFLNLFISFWKVIFPSRNLIGSRHRIAKSVKPSNAACSTCNDRKGIARSTLSNFLHGVSFLLEVFSVYIEKRAYNRASENWKGLCGRWLWWIPKKLPIQKPVIWLWMRTRDLWASWKLCMARLKETAIVKYFGKVRWRWSIALPSWVEFKTCTKRYTLTSWACVLKSVWVSYVCKHGLPELRVKLYQMNCSLYYIFPPAWRYFSPIPRHFSTITTTQHYKQQWHSAFLLLLIKGTMSLRIIAQCLEVIVNHRWWFTRNFPAYFPRQWYTMRLQHNHNTTFISSDSRSINCQKFSSQKLAFSLSHTSTHANKLASIFKVACKNCCDDSRPRSNTYEQPIPTPHLTRSLSPLLEILDSLSPDQVHILLLSSTSCLHYTTQYSFGNIPYTLWIWFLTQRLSNFSKVLMMERRLS